ncbi:hypothetical protein RI367_004519 [Sorochytrium milnesiophthora]
MALNSFRVFVLTIVALALYFTFRPGEAPGAAKQRRAAIPTVPPQQCTAAGTVAMTFDDGVSDSNTPPVLDALKAAGVKATFHLSSQWMNVDQLVNAIVSRIVADGHVVGMRYWGPDLSTMTNDQIVGNLTAQANTIYSVIGKYPRYLRLPLGSWNGNIQALTAGMGFTTTMWNIDSSDYLACNATSQFTPQAAAAAYAAAMQGFKAAGNFQGSFISLHTDLCPIASGVAACIKTAQSYNYKFVTMDQCLGDSTAYKYSAGTFGSPPSSSSGGGAATAGGGAGSSAPTPTTTAGSVGAQSKPNHSPRQAAHSWLSSLAILIVATVAVHLL